MKRIMLIGFIFLLTSSYAFSSSMNCDGVTNEGVKYAVTFDLEKMEASINGEKHSIVESKRLNSYMRGTQFLRMSSKKGDHYTDVRSELLWTTYYSRPHFSNLSISFKFSRTGEDESVWLKCDPDLYNGPTSYKE